MADKKTNFSVGDVFAVSTGKYLGEFFVFIEHKNSIQYFLSLPKMINRKIETKHIQHALDNKILEFQENLPQDIRHMCVEQHKKNNAKNIRRRK